MIGQIIENRIIEYIMAAACILYVSVKVISASCYAYIAGKSKDIDNSRSRFIQKLRGNLLKEYERSGDIQNAGVLVDTYMNRAKIAGFKMVFWDNAERLAITTGLFAGITGIFAAYADGRPLRLIIYYAFLSVSFLWVVLIFGIVFNTGYKKRCIYTNICSHFENYVFPALKNGAYDYGIQNMQKLSEEIDTGMLELIKNIDNSEQVEKEDTKVSDDGSEQRILEEIINEYLT